MRGFQANSLKVAEHIPLKTAFCRFHDNDYNTNYAKIQYIILQNKLTSVIIFETLAKKGESHEQ